MTRRGVDLTRADGLKRGQLAGFERAHLIENFGEEEWALDSPGAGPDGSEPPPRYARGVSGPTLALVSAVLYTVGDGKEATAYCCRASPEAPFELALAKIYRATKFRAFANAARYRAGEKLPDRRAQKAIEQNSRRGRDMGHTTWVEREWNTLCMLHDMGADVPTPYACTANAILMEYFGDETTPAPLLLRVDLERAEAERLFERLVQNVELFLACDRIHGDLSAYNVLYDAGKIWIIDFPQAVDARTHPNARALLERDLSNLARPFERSGLRTRARERARELFERYRRGELGIDD